MAVVGISGGIDSAVVASVCVGALGPSQVYLVSMPYGETDLKTFNRRSEELAKKLKANHLVINIGFATDALLAVLEKDFVGRLRNITTLHRLTQGNARARMRMAVLYGVAGELSYHFSEQLFSPGSEVISPIQHEKRVRVIGTGNASEDLIGYDTKGGDALADLFVIGDLFKSEVYQLAKYYGVPESIVTAVPSAGLYEGQTDKDELGYTYDQLEPATAALHRALRRGIKDEELTGNLNEFVDLSQKEVEFVIGRFKANAHKHRAPAVVLLRGTEFVVDRKN